MTDVTVTRFLFEGEIPLRVVDRDGALWFVAADVCRALGLTNPAETVRSLEEDERGISITDTDAGPWEMVVVSESGLYGLVFKSRKPNALRFRKWVTSEVLPSIRRTGIYSAPSEPGLVLPRKAWPNWSLEERRIALSEVNTARRVFNQGAAAWVWGRVGFPVPPPHFLPVWWQADLHLTGTR